MTHRCQELLFGLALLAAGGGLMLHSFDPQYALMAQDIETGPVFFPRIILTVWLVCAAAITVRAWLSGRRETVDFAWGRMLAAVAILSAFVLLFDTLGYFVCGLCCFFGLGRVLGYAGSPRLLLISVAYAGFTDILFRVGLKLYLPVFSL